MDVAIGVVIGICAGAVATGLVLKRRGRGPDGPSHDGATDRAELISNIAHELKNPVMSIKGLASTGSRLYGSLTDEERAQLFRLIDAEAARLRVIAEETSTAMKLDAGTIGYQLQPDDVGELVRQTAWRTPVGEHPIEVDVDDDLRAPVDRTRFAEALTNAIDNAAKFSPAGAPILVGAAREGDHVVVTVTDAGPGIPAEQREAVFERYASWRPSGYEHVQGAGLGLFIARSHVLAHGGRMAFEAPPDGGTMLRITLPGEG